MPRTMDGRCAGRKFGKEILRMTENNMWSYFPRMRSYGTTTQINQWIEILVTLNALLSCEEKHGNRWQNNNVSRTIIFPALDDVFVVPMWCCIVLPYTLCTILLIIRSIIIIYDVSIWVSNYKIIVLTTYIILPRS